MTQKIIDIEDLKKSIGVSNDSNLFNYKEIITEFISKNNIGRITRIRDVELDKISRLFYFGITHTVYLNLDDEEILTYYNLGTFEWNNIHISSILQYVVINLSFRLSLDGQSRIELKEIMTSVIKQEIEKNINSMKNTEDR